MSDKDRENTTPEDKFVEEYRKSRQGRKSAKATGTEKEHVPFLTDAKSSSRRFLLRAGEQAERARLRFGKVGTYVLLAVVVSLGAMLVVQSIRLDDTTDQLERKHRKARKKLATCKTALKSYVKSFHSAEKQTREGHRTLARQSRTVTTLSELVARREKAKSKLDEYNADLVLAIKGLKDKKGAELRKQHKKVAKLLKRREFYNKRVNSLNGQMDQKIARLERQLASDKDPRKVKVPKDARLARKQNNKKRKRAKSTAKSR